MNLVRAEIGRLAARRFAQVMLLLLIGAFAITIATTLAGSHQPTASELARAEEQADQRRQENARWYAECLAARQPDAQPTLDWRYGGNCEDLNPSLIDPADYLSGVFVFEQQIIPLVYFLIAFLALFGFLVGASYIGADLNSGGMTNLLLWRPQRMTVLGTKLGTLLAAVLSVSVLASAFYLGAFWLIAQVGGMPGTLNEVFWTDLSLSVGRGLLLCLLATTLGFAIATLGRHTSAALGVVAGYVVVWEAGARLVMEIIDLNRPGLWVLSSYLVAFADGRFELMGTANCVNPSRGCGPEIYIVNWVGGLSVLLAVVGLFTAGAFASFRQRDLS